MVFAELNQDGLQELKMTGVSFAYHVRLLKLVEIIGQYKSSEVRSSEIPMSKLSDSTATIKESKMNITIFFVDCVIELNPFDGAAKGLFLVKDGQVVLSLGQNSSSNSLNLNIHKSWTLLIDDVDYLDKTAATTTHKQRYIHSQDFVNSFLKQGYTMIASLSSISSNFSISPHSTGELNIELLAIDSCADSTQILIKLINGLKPQIEAQEDVRYRTEPYPANVFENIDENAFGDHSVLQNDISRFSEDMVSDDVPSNLDFVESYYTEQPSRYKWSGSSSGVSSSSHYSKADLLLDQDLSLLAAKSGGSSGDGSSLHNSGDSFQSSFGIFEQRVQSHDSVLAISDDYFSQKQKSSRSNSVNTIYSAHSDKTQQNFKRGKDSLSLAMFRIDVKCEKIIWNLYDGYDWEYTRNAISSAVKRVEVVANEVHRQFEKEKEEAATTNFTEQDDDHIDVLENAVVGDLLFNSIYVGVPASQDPKDLRKEINRDINMNDDATESSSLSGSSFNRSKTSNSSRRASMDYKKRLKLRRSKTHKVAIKIEKLNVELSVFDTLESSKVEDGILLNRVGIKIRDLEILDNVSTSTWNKFLFYMRSAGEREYDADMADIVLDSVRPVHDLAVSELILTVSVLPLRLHVDQDTLDFLTRFFEFKDDRIYLGENLDEEEIFIQKADIHAIKVKLDYKPKKVDYAGLKSGHTTEFMNFFVLDEADIVLKHVELYGVSGFPKLAKILNGIWMPDIRTTQLGDVLAGLAPVRSLVRLGNGVRDLIWIPIEEYQKDGRLVRGIQKGAWTFARNATTELVKLGAKLAAGTQAILESAEQAMGGSGAAARVHERPGKRYVSPYSDSLEDYEDEEEFYHEYSEDIPSLTGSYEASLSSIGGNGSNVQHLSQRKIISLYADQPQNIRQGITLAYQSLGRNMSLASQAVQDIGPDAAQRGSAKGAAAAVAKAAPVAIIRPLIGTTEAVSRTLLGVTNQLDPEQMKDVEDVSIIIKKKHI